MGLGGSSGILTLRANGTGDRRHPLIILTGGGEGGYGESS